MSKFATAYTLAFISILNVNFNSIRNNMPNPKRARYTTYDNASNSVVLVTHSTIDLTDNFVTEDDKNLTTCNRQLYKYAKALGFSGKARYDVIQRIIKDQHKLTKTKLKILDSGCGNGTAIDQILSNVELVDLVQQCVGISTHYFGNIKNVLAKHEDRFKYYYGAVQDALDNVHDEYDLLFDIYGAFFYSFDSFALLAKFYQALKPGGIGYIRLGYSKAVSMNTKTSINFSCYLTEYYPQVFEMGANDEILIMRKSLPVYPVPKFRVISYAEKISIGADVDFQTAKRGNAVAPEAVLFSRASKQRVTLPKPSEASLPPRRKSRRKLLS